MYGRLEQAADGRWRLGFTRTFGDSPESVWRAITEPSQLAAWFPTTIEGERAPGAPLTFAFPQQQAPPFTGEMLTFEPMSLMELRWGTDALRLELRGVDGGSQLTLTDTLEELGRASLGAAGWHECLDALAVHLGADDTGASWPSLFQAYVERFGPEASTVGPPEGMLEGGAGG